MLIVPTRRETPQLTIHPLAITPLWRVYAGPKHECKAVVVTQFYFKFRQSCTVFRLLIILLNTSIDVLAYNVRPTFYTGLADDHTEQLNRFSSPCKLSIVNAADPSARRCASDVIRPGSDVILPESIVGNMP